jgi:NADPH-dependent 2,4-dienoyl-CoA reductase/sulfur reductase-like enzyme
MSPVIVGAGPAGVRAAQTLVRYGLRPIVLDESPRWGGQIYRQQPGNFKRSPRDLYGFEAERAVQLHAAMHAVLDKVDYRASSLVWGAEAGHLDVLRTGQNERVPFRNLILTTGATDRVLPFPGWTLPGVYTLGGAQVALKFQGCGIGQRVVFAGSGPLLYLVAYQYAKAGAKVVAVIDHSSLGAKMAGLFGMSRQSAVLAKGVYYTTWLRAHGVPVHQGARLVKATGHERVGEVTWSDGVREHTLSSDAVGFGYGLRSETQLADLVGCAFAYDMLQRAHLPERDAVGRSSVPGVYLAGDGAGIRGADAAEWAGELAALALVADLAPQTQADAQRMAMLQAKLANIAAFRHGLERAFPFPDDWAAQAEDGLTICRCEEITAGELRTAIATCGVKELNRLKALTRVGMGRCQGRMCGVAAGEILAHATGKPVCDVGRLRAQAPVKPIPFAMLQSDRRDAP